MSNVHLALRLAARKKTSLRLRRKNPEVRPFGGRTQLKRKKGVGALACAKCVGPYCLFTPAKTSSIRISILGEVINR